MLGILGGMGPLATVDFMQKVVALSQVATDQNHMPILVHNVPQIPDRSACILHGGEDPFPALLKGLKRLEHAGATCIVIPCNTAHYWFDALQGETSVKMISIIDVVCREILQRGIIQTGLMATNATVAAGLYKKRIRSMGGRCINPEELTQQQLMTSIYDVKAGRLNQGSQGMEEVFNHLVGAGAEAVILGCTEIPIGLAKIARENPELCIDATELLAKACVDWYYTDHDNHFQGDFEQYAA
ncbi:amino acid racemase [uncultured Endozoicomonas sp.]|uniref:aspartate/glutamate racemase family protein n=1 Tax=uncultured Endozoicomonas sp. TaxID=432652 RepID=UPI0026097A3A|nr:amino acid racemase [uncultured Endozoicomonas sp.]